MISSRLRLATVAFALVYLSSPIQAGTPFLGCLSSISAFTGRIPLAPTEVCAEACHGLSYEYAYTQAIDDSCYCGDVPGFAMLYADSKSSHSAGGNGSTVDCQEGYLVQATSSRFSFLTCTPQESDANEQLGSVPFSLNCLGKCAGHKYASFIPNKTNDNFQCQCSDSPPDIDLDQAQRKCTATSRYWYTRPVRQDNALDGDKRDNAIVKELIGAHGKGLTRASGKGKQSLVWGRRGRTKAFCPKSLIACETVHER